MKTGLGVFASLIVLPLVLGGCGGSSGNPTPNQGTLASSTGAITEFPTNSGDFAPVKVMKGSDGNLWILELCCRDIGVIAKIAIDGTVSSVGSVQGLINTAFGPDGNLWFITNSMSNGLGKMTTAGTPQGSFPVNAVGSQITVGPDSNLWVEALAGSSLEFDVYSTAGTFLHSLAISSATISMTSGPDGNFWFAFGNNVVKMTPAGIATTFTFPQVQTFFNLMTTGPDGNLWLCVGDSGIGNDAIARLTTSGTLTLFPLPTPNSNPFGITSGPDGNLWFTESRGNKIGRITPSGTVTEFALPTANVQPSSIVAGPDGFLWFTEQAAFKVGKIHP